MRIQIDTRNWKTYPKYAGAILALLGFANFADLVRWVRGLGDPRPSSLEEEAVQRRAGDSALLARINANSALLARIESNSGRDSAHLSRIEQGMVQVQDWLLKVPEVEKYYREQEREDSVRRAEERRRRRLFGDREVRGPWRPDLEIR